MQLASIPNYEATKSSWFEVDKEKLISKGMELFTYISSKKSKTHDDEKEISQRISWLFELVTYVIETQREEDPKHLENFKLEDIFIGVYIAGHKGFIGIDSSFYEKLSSTKPEFKQAAKELLFDLLTILMNLTEGTDLSGIDKNRPMHNRILHAKPHEINKETSLEHGFDDHATLAPVFGDHGYLVKLQNVLAKL